MAAMKAMKKAKEDNAPEKKKAKFSVSNGRPLKPKVHASVGVTQGTGTDFSNCTIQMLFGMIGCASNTMQEPWARTNLKWPKQIVQAYWMTWKASTPVIKFMKSKL